MGQYFPIVYVRGYAMTQGEVEQTFNMPHYGFNLGSTQFKLSAGDEPEMYIFESPVVRLMKDEGYEDSFNRYVTPYNVPIKNSVPAGTRPLPDDEGEDENGTEIENWRRTLWVFRYYDVESKLAEVDERVRPEDRKTVDGYAADLAIFLNRVCHACGNPRDFKVYLVAHSMGGLVARSYLQNRKIFGKDNLAETRLDEMRARNLGGGDLKTLRKIKVRKLFTFGTPHRGITFRRGLGWAEDVRDLFGFSGSDAFGPKQMRRYLDLRKPRPLNDYRQQAYGPPLKNVFALVGTNHEDYTVRVAKAGVGPGSDGLVAIENAHVRGAPRALVHRSHSGPFGIVNSEAGYQNLTRFLFGDLRFKLFLILGQIDPAKLPGLLNKEDALAYFLTEVQVAIRGLPGYIHTRTAQNMSAIRIAMVKSGRTGMKPADDMGEGLHLYTGYLRRRYVMKRETDEGKKPDDYVRGAVDIRLEPHFTHDGWIRDSRYEGDWVMNDRLHFGVKDDGGKISLAWRWAAERDEQELVVDDVHFIDLPPSVRNYLPDGRLRLMFDAWS